MTTLETKVQFHDPAGEPGKQSPEPQSPEPATAPAPPPAALPPAPSGPKTTVIEAGSQSLPPPERPRGTHVSAHPSSTRVVVHSQPEYEEIAPGVKIHKGGGPPRTGGTRVTLHAAPEQRGKIPAGTTHVAMVDEPQLIEGSGAEPSQGPRALPPPDPQQERLALGADSAALSAAELKKEKVADLRDALSQMGLETGGKKAELIDRLVAFGFEGWE